MSDTDAEFSMPRLAPMVAAVRAAGIPVRSGPVPDDLLLPGVTIDRGALVVEERKLLYPGDIVHEAGHIAVMPPEVRPLAVGTLPGDAGQEMAAIAWSYALAVAHALPVEMIFHDAFKGGGPMLRETFATGGWIGVPLLQCWDMTRLANARPGFEHLPVFPAMAKWLRDAPDG